VRGNERRNIFRDEHDFRMFIRIIGEAAETYQFIIHAYALMNNHYHVLIEIKLPNISQIMQYVNTAYGIYFNKRHKRCGHLLQGRFDAILVEHGENLKFVSAYIHLNPARAGIVKQVTDYEWSSYRQYTGGVINGIAEPAYILSLFSKGKGYLCIC
jgi:REP element-mobilizing transposase RayT